MIEQNQATYDFIREHLHGDIAKLLFQKKRFPNVDMDFAVKQIVGYKKASQKIPTLARNEKLLYPIGISMEQCSSEYTARYKAKLLKDKRIVDITGGLGVDDFFISEEAKEVLYIEQNAELFEIASHNFKLFDKKNIYPICSDGLLFLKESTEKYDCIYLDPSRRNTNKQKVLLLEDCLPDILKCKNLLLSKANSILLKASPMLDITKSLKDLENVREVHIVALDNECKELLFLCTHEKTERTQLICVNIFSKGEESVFKLFADDEAKINTPYASVLKTYLYEPNSSILKAGAFKSIAKQFEIEKLQMHSHLYTSDRLIQNFPGKIFQIETHFSLNEKNIKEYLPARKANIVVRNFPLSPQEIGKKHKIQEGGSDVLFATTLQNDEKKMILCKRRL